MLADGREYSPAPHQIPLLPLLSDSVSKAHTLGRSAHSAFSDQLWPPLGILGLPRHDLSSRPMPQPPACPLTPIPHSAPGFHDTRRGRTGTASMQGSSALKPGATTDSGRHGW